MKKKYTEQYIRNLIEDRVFPNLSGDEERFSLNHLVAGSIVKRNGSDFRVDCAIDVNEQALLVVFLDNVQSDEEVIFHQFHFAHMQGIKVKRKGLFQKVTVQFKDGRNYVFELANHQTKQLPNQRENVQSFITILEAKNLHDMTNKIHKQNMKSHRKMAVSYVATLIAFLIAAMYFSVNVFPNSMFLMIVIVIGSGIIHFISYMIGYVFLYTRKDRPFVKEFNAILQVYQKNHNVEELLRQLENMKTKPKTPDSKNTFYLTMSTALHENNRTKEALACLDQVQTTSEKEIEMIAEQRNVLESADADK